MEVRTVQDVPEKFRSVFTYPEFNRVQSAVFPDLMESNDSIVVTAPTGSGKTVLFELALVNLLNHCPDVENIKAVYVAPVKALCSERCMDWRGKFEPLGLSCIEVTGDSMDDVNLQGFQLILTTPEKWDSLTRRRDNFVKMVKVMLIDEVHLLSDETRGPTLETIVCRMKTLKTGIRFVAVSATVFNLEDLAAWFGDVSCPARMHKFGNEVRPVALRRVVKSFTQGNQSAYLFDMQLSYKLKAILMEYSEGKPALVFCSTRRGVVQTSQTLFEQLEFQFTPQQSVMLKDVARKISDNKLKDFLKSGIGYHHAGMTSGDRHVVQEVFTQGFLPVLVATTTLAMGVNLPAHLVVIKSTYQYVSGSYVEYPETYILQMVGRAGRPQFDTTATAVIMTRTEMSHKYENLLDCKEIMESSLHRNLAEHLNSEIVLYTITDLGVAMDWLRCTFLYQRAFKNPAYYGLTKQNINKELETMLLKEMNALKNTELVELVNGMDVSPTPNGRLMSHYYLSLKTFQIFQKVDGKTTIPELLTLLSAAHEFNITQLRVNEKKTLNSLNNNKLTEKIRFPLSGKIKTREMKINCLVQAILGCLTIPDPALLQEALRIVSLMERIVKCLIEYLSRKPCYVCFYNAVVLGKCLHAKLWENSVHVARQLERIGPALGSCLVSAGVTSFQRLVQSHPCELERIMNRGPPLGGYLIHQVKSLPIYELSVELDRESVLNSKVRVGIQIQNSDIVSEENTAGRRHAVFVIVGDTNNRLLHQRRVPDRTLVRGGFRFTVYVKPPQPKRILVKVVSEQWVGIDVDHEVLVNLMAKDLLDDDGFKETRSKVTRKRTRKVDPVTFSPKVLTLLEGKKKKKVVSPAVDCCFDLEPDWPEFSPKHDLEENLDMIADLPVENFENPVQDFGSANEPSVEEKLPMENDDHLMDDSIDHLMDDSIPWQITQILGKFQEEPVKEPLSEVPSCLSNQVQDSFVGQCVQDFGSTANEPSVDEKLPMENDDHLMDDSIPWQITQILGQCQEEPVKEPLSEVASCLGNQIQDSFVGQCAQDFGSTANEPSVDEKLPMENDDHLMDDSIPWQMTNILGKFQEEPVNEPLLEFPCCLDNQIWDSFVDQCVDDVDPVPETNSVVDDNNPWKITQIVESLNSDPVSFELYDSQALLPQEPVTTATGIQEQPRFPPIPYPKDVLWGGFSSHQPVSTTALQEKPPSPRKPVTTATKVLEQPPSPHQPLSTATAKQEQPPLPQFPFMRDVLCTTFSPHGKKCKENIPPAKEQDGLWGTSSSHQPVSTTTALHEKPPSPREPVTTATKVLEQPLSTPTAVQKQPPLPQIPYHPKDVLWASFSPPGKKDKENIPPVKEQFLVHQPAPVKPLNKSKSLKDFYPVVKAVRKLTKNVNDEKCFD